MGQDGSPMRGGDCRRWERVMESGHSMPAPNGPKHLRQLAWRGFLRTHAGKSPRGPCPFGWLSPGEAGLEVPGRGEGRASRLQEAPLPLLPSWLRYSWTNVAPGPGSAYPVQVARLLPPWQAPSRQAPCDTVCNQTPPGLLSS